MPLNLLSGLPLVALAIAATTALVARASGARWSVGPVEWLWRHVAYRLWSVSQLQQRLKVSHGQYVLACDGNAGSDDAVRG